MSDSPYNMKEVYDQVRGILGEHFHSFCFIVSDEAGDIYYDFTNFRVGKMLMTEGLEELKSETGDIEFIWEEIEDSEEDSEGFDPLG